MVERLVAATDGSLRGDRSNSLPTLASELFDHQSSLPRLGTDLFRPVGRAEVYIRELPSKDERLDQLVDSIRLEPLISQLT